MMKKEFNEKDYLELVRLLTEQQYQEHSAQDDVELQSYTSTKSAIKYISNNYKECSDLSICPRDKIESEICSSGSVKIENFLVKLKRGLNSEVKKELGISIMEDKFTTPSGMPCKISVSIDPNKDSRFNNRPWITYFAGNKTAYNVPLETVVEIVKYLQVINKLKAFV